MGKSQRKEARRLPLGRAHAPAMRSAQAPPVSRAHRALTCTDFVDGRNLENDAVAAFRGRFFDPSSGGLPRAESRFRALRMFAQRNAALQSVRIRRAKI